MRIPAVLAALLLASSAWAFSRTWSIVQNATGTAPTASCGAAGNSSATCGISLREAKQVRVCVWAPDAQTLSGTGTVELHVYSDVKDEWGVDDENELALSKVAANGECFTREVSMPMGRLFPVPAGVGLSGGTQVTITVEVFW